MATTEHNGLMVYKDENGNLRVLYPITKADLVDGLPELLAEKSNTDHKHGAGDITTGVLPPERGGTGMDSLEGLLSLAGTGVGSYLTFVTNANANAVNAAFGKNNEDRIHGIGAALAMYARYSGETTEMTALQSCDKLSDILTNGAATSEVVDSDALFAFCFANEYFSEKFDAAEAISPPLCLFKGGVSDYFDLSACTISNGNISFAASVQVSSKSTVSREVELQTKAGVSLDLTKFYKTLRIKFAKLQASGDSFFTATISTAFNGVSISSVSGQPPINKDGSEVITSKDFMPSLRNSQPTLKLTASLYNSHYMNKLTGSFNVEIAEIWLE